MKEKIFYTKGMHCASCELLIERKLLEQKGVKAVSASTKDSRVVLEVEDSGPSVQELNSLFKKENYYFSEQPFNNNQNGQPKTNWVAVLAIAAVIVTLFVWLGKSGWASVLSINSSSSLFVIFLFGVVAGLSSCAALVGGLVLSMSKQWGEIYSANDSTTKKLEPHLIFNLGRLLSYGFFGALLGGIGKSIQLSSGFAPVLIIAVSFVMLALGLQMLGVKYFRKFQISIPKIITRNIADEKNFKGKYMPFVLGALTFFLPCGFTLATQALALISGGFLRGSFIMMAFALGTMPTLFVIGLSAVKLKSNHKLEDGFSKVAAILVIFFALFNLNAQLNVLGYKSLSDIKLGFTNDSNSAVCQSAACEIDKAFSSSNNNTSQNKISDDAGALPAIVGGKQIVKMNASSAGYSPSALKVKAGIPIRWEITDTGTSGCTNGIISHDLFDGQINLTVGQTSVKEFTIAKPGTYKFSCWMGMVNGTFEAVN